MGKTKNKRTPRKKPSVKKLNPQVPIDLDKLGTEEDCFGNLYEPVTEECHACGDSELCAIIHKNTINNKRKLAEKTQKFKDTEEAVNTPNFMPMSEFKTKVVKAIRKNKRVKASLLITKLKKKYDPKGLLPPDRVSELLRVVVKSSKNLKTYKENGKRYIRYVSKKG